MFPAAKDIDLGVIFRSILLSFCLKPSCKQTIFCIVVSIRLRLTEVIDTTSPGGRMMMQIVGTFAEFERAMLRERTHNGLDAARKQGRIGGRRPKLKKHQQHEILHLVNSGKKTAERMPPDYSMSIQLPYPVS
jgi:hypothetical protein